MKKKIGSYDNHSTSEKAFEAIFLKNVSKKILYLNN